MKWQKASFSVVKIYVTWAFSHHFFLFLFIFFMFNLTNNYTVLRLETMCCCCCCTKMKTWIHVLAIIYHDEICSGSQNGRVQKKKLEIWFSLSTLNQHSSPHKRETRWNEKKKIRRKKMDDDEVVVKSRTRSICSMVVVQTTIKKKFEWKICCVDELLIISVVLI